MLPGQMNLVINEELSQLLLRTQALHSAAIEHVDSLRPIENTRTLLAFQAGCLALDHSLAIQALVVNGHLPSAYALFRTQFENLVRGIWLLHAASDAWIEKFAQPLTIEGSKQANEGPRFVDMLTDLESNPSSPRHIVNQLREYKEATWKPLNSYTHGGIHPLTRRLTGFPPQLTFDAVRNANAVLALTLQLLSILTGDMGKMEPVRRMHVDFVDCFNLLPSNP